MRVLVTGGAGYVGSHAAKQLAATGHDVLIVDKLSEGHRAPIVKLPFVSASLLEPQKLISAMNEHRTEAVMHFAAFAYVGVSVKDPAIYYHNNIVGSLTLLAAMREAKVNRIVFSSSCATYGNPQRI